MPSRPSTQHTTLADSSASASAGEPGAGGGRPSVPMILASLCGGGGEEQEAGYWRLGCWVGRLTLQEWECAVGKGGECRTGPPVPTTWKQRSCAVSCGMSPAPVAVHSLRTGTAKQSPHPAGRAPTRRQALTRPLPRVCTTMTLSPAAVPAPPSAPAPAAPGCRSGPSRTV